MANWADVLEVLEGRLSKPSFDTWFKETQATIEEDRWIITAPNEFSKDWLEERYSSMIVEAITELTTDTPNLTFIHNTEQPTEKRYSLTKIELILQKIETLTIEEKKLLIKILNNSFEDPTPELNESFKSNLNNGLTFENFIQNSGNRFPVAAAQSVANTPGKAYNPLFIYSGSALGKTHLLHAIGNYIQQKDPSKKVRYTGTNQFLSDFLESISQKKEKEFREKYRNLDVLLIDDIHFLVGKEQIQDEFFHTFNYLHFDSKQIVITANCHPQKLESFNEQIKSRFEWGLITELTANGQATHKNQLEAGIDSKKIDYLEKEIIAMKGLLFELQDQVDGIRKNEVVIKNMD